MMAYIQNHEEANRQFEEAQADYEIERVLAKDEIMNDPETDRALKIKIIREDLKTLGQWATASKPVILIDGGQVKAPDNAFNFQFVGMSDERKAAIKAETERTDSQQIDADPQDGNE